jgi:hypothetical protein
VCLEPGVPASDAELGAHYIITSTEMTTRSQPVGAPPARHFATLACLHRSRSNCTGEKSALSSIAKIRIGEELTVKHLLISAICFAALSAGAVAQTPTPCTSCTDFCAAQRDECGHIACAAAGGKWVNKYCQSVPFGKTAGHTGKLKTCSNKANDCVSLCQANECRAK